MMSDAIVVRRYLGRAAWLLLPILLLQGCTPTKKIGVYEVVHEGKLSPEYRYMVMISVGDDGERSVKFRFLKGEDILAETDCADGDLSTIILSYPPGGGRNTASAMCSGKLIETQRWISNKQKTDVILDTDGDGFPDTWLTTTEKDRITREVVLSVVKTTRRPANQ